MDIYRYACNTVAVRDAFERWAKGKGFDLDKHPNDIYTAQSTYEAWKTWEGVARSVEVSQHNPVVIRAAAEFFMQQGGQQ